MNTKSFTRFLVILLTMLTPTLAWSNNHPPQVKTFYSEYDYRTGQQVLEFDITNFNYDGNNNWWTGEQILINGENIYFNNDASQGYVGNMLGVFGTSNEDHPINHQKTITEVNSCDSWLGGDNHRIIDIDETGSFRTANGTTGTLRIHSFQTKQDHFSGDEDNSLGSSKFTKCRITLKINRYDAITVKWQGYWHNGDAGCVHDSNNNNHCTTEHNQYTFTFNMAAHIHSWGDYTENRDASYTKDGTKSRTCGICGATESTNSTFFPKWGYKVSNYENGGTVSSQVSADGKTVTFTCTPYDGYVFDYWRLDNGTNLTSNPLVYTKGGSVSATAYYKAICQVASDDPAMGSVTGGGTYAVGSTVTLTATPANGYRFLRWSDGNTSSQRTITLDWPTSLTAYFKASVISSFPWTEDFEEMATNQDITADDWTNEHISGPDSYLFKVSSNTHGDNSSHQGQLPDMDAGTITRLTLPPMNLGEPSTYQFSIDVYRNGSSDSNTEGLRIFVGDQELGFISRCYAVADGERVPAETASGWYTYQFVIPVGGEQHIIIQGESQYRSATYFDNLVVDLAPTCQKPTGIHILPDLTTGTSATIAWSAPATGAERYQVVVTSGSNFNDTLVNTLVTDTFCTVSGLEQVTAYTLNTTVIAVCSDDEQSLAAYASLSVMTECSTIASLPWNEGFEDFAVGDETNSGLVCWDLLNCGGWNHPQVYVKNTTSYIHTGARSMVLSPINNRHAYAILPEVTTDLSQAEISFWYRHESTSVSNGILSFGYMTDPTDSTTFVALQTMETSDTMTEIAQSLARVPAGARLAFRVIGRSNALRLGIDDISIYYPTCPAADNIHIVDDLTTGTSATIAWANTGAEQYRVVVKNGSDTLVNTLTTDTFCVVNGLQMGINYTLRATVTSVCDEDDESIAAVASLTVTTLCETISSFPWTEDFEGMATGENITAGCWTNEHISGTGTDLFRVFANSNDGNSSHQGWLPDMSAGTITRLGLPLMDFGEPNTYRFSIDVYRSSTDSRYTTEGLRIFAGDQELGFISRNITVADGGSVPAETASGWYTYQFVIPVGGEQRIIIQGESQWGSATYFDNLVVDLAPSCLPVSNIHILNNLTTSASATIAWAAPATGAEQYRTIVTSGIDTLVNTLVTDTFYVVSGLESSTSYTLSATVTSVCGEGDESDPTSASLTVYIPCDAITSFPWTEDFEGMTAGEIITAACWTNEHISGEGTHLFKVIGSDHGGNTTIKAYLPDMDAGTITRLTLPNMYFGEPNTCLFSIDVYRSTNYSYATEGLRIFAGEEELGFISRNHTVADGIRVPAESEIGWYTYEFVIPVGGEQRIIIQGESQWGLATHFDNLVVKVNPNAPTEFDAAAPSGALRAEKIIRNGHIYIVLPDGTTFDATGRRM